jgi:hypothetical protein
MSSLTKNGKPIELPAGFESQDNYIELKIEEMKGLCKSQSHYQVGEWVNLVKTHMGYITKRIDLPKILLEEYDSSVINTSFDNNDLAIKNAKNYLTNLISYLENSYTSGYVPQRITLRF